MGATSTQGVGLGAVTNNKGSEHQTLGVGHLVGPRVVAAGKATLSGGTVDVVLPKFSGAATDYVVMTNDITGNAASNGTIAFGTNDATITLNGTGTHEIQYAVIKTGASGLKGIGS